MDLEWLSWRVAQLEDRLRITVELCGGLAEALGDTQAAMERVRDELRARELEESLPGE